MQYNVVVVLPSYENMTDVFMRGLENTIYAALNNVRAVKFLQNSAEFYSLMYGYKGLEYNVCIVLDVPGKGQEYIDLLRNIMSKNKNLRVLLVVPNRCKGTMDLKKVIIERGITNILMLAEVNKSTIYERVSKDRSFEEAVYYCDVANVFDEPGLIKWGSEVEKRAAGYEYEKQSAEEKYTVRKLPNGVTVKRIYGKDAAVVFSKGNEDEEMLAFLNNSALGLEREDAEMPLYPVEVVPANIERYANDISQYFRQKGMEYFRSFEKGDIAVEDMKKLAMAVFERMDLTVEEKEQAFNVFVKETKSYGKLDVLIEDDNVTDIRLTGPESVNVQVKGVWYRTNITFKNEDAFRMFIGKICNRNKVQLNIANKDVIFTDVDTSPKARLRFSANSDVIATDGLPGLHIRKIFKNKKTAQTLIKEGLWSPKQAGLIINEFKRGKSVVFCGGSGSGKTVVVNCVVDYGMANVCGACVQEAEEIFSEILKNLQWFHTIESSGEAKVKYTLKQAANSALLKNAELFIIGEIKGDEAEEFARAAFTGAQCVTTTHSKTVFNALPNLANLARNAKGITQSQQLQRLGENIDMVVYLEKYKVKDIARVVEYSPERDDILYDLYEFNDQEGVC